MSEALKQYIDQVEDFPKPGVKFRDISPLLAGKFPETIAEMIALYDTSLWQEVDVIAGVDARGFIFAASIAEKLGKQLALIRKKGKLPPPVVSLTYQLEYGSDTLEMKMGEGNIVIVDDVLATGGTLTAAADLASKAGYEVSCLITAVNLAHLNNFSWNGLQAHSLIEYHD